MPVWFYDGLGHWLSYYMHFMWKKELDANAGRIKESVDDVYKRYIDALNDIRGLGAVASEMFLYEELRKERAFAK